jgi:hypothetical protein
VEKAVIAGLLPDDAQARRVLARARLLARELDAELVVVRLYPAAWRGAVASNGWRLLSDEPGAALRRFAARRRAVAVVL